MRDVIVSRGVTADAIAYLQPALGAWPGIGTLPGAFEANDGSDFSNQHVVEDACGLHAGEPHVEALIAVDEPLVVDA